VILHVIAEVNLVNFCTAHNSENGEKLIHNCRTTPSKDSSLISQKGIKEGEMPNFCTKQYNFMYPPYLQ